MCVSVKRPKEDAGCHALSLSTLFPWVLLGNHRGPEDRTWSQAGSQQAPVIILSLFPTVLGSQMTVWLHLNFPGDAGI